MSSYANLDAREGIVTSETTITFNFKPRRIVITNDSGNQELTFKFNSSETEATLKPTETITMEVASRTIILNSISANYRVWAIG